MEKEKWKTISRFDEDGKPPMQISNQGRLRRGVKYYTQRINSRGYYICSFRLYGKPITVTIHRLVAEHFCERVTGADIVNHEDGNKLNNAADNLTWCTQSENVKHAYDAGLNWKRGCYSTPIIAKHREGKPKRFKSISAAVRELGESKNTIQRHLRNGTTSKRGYTYQEADSSHG